MAKSGQMVRLRGVLKRFWKQSLGIVAVIAAYLISGIHVANVAVSESERLSDERRVIRIAHSLSDRRVIRAFRRIADDYERMHPDVKVSVQSIPQRAYEQWVTTQLMGGTAPDLVQVLRLSGSWAVLAQQYFVALTPYIVEENPYNEGTELEGRPWRSTFTDGMEGGYFMHLEGIPNIDALVPVFLDPARAFSTPRHWGNDLALDGSTDMNYADLVHNYLESPAIDCRAAREQFLGLGGTAVVSQRGQTWVHRMGRRSHKVSGGRGE